MYVKSKIPIFLFSYFYAGPMTNIVLNSKLETSFYCSFNMILFYAYSWSCWYPQCCIIAITGWVEQTDRLAIWKWPFLIYRKRQYILYAQIKNWVSPKYVRSRTRNKSRTISIQFFKRFCLIICYTRMLIIETVSYDWYCGTMAWFLKIALPYFSPA